MNMIERSVTLLQPVTEQQSEPSSTSKQSTTSDTSDSNQKQLSSNSEKLYKDQSSSDKLIKGTSGLLYKSLLKCVGNFE